MAEPMPLVEILAEATRALRSGHLDRAEAGFLEALAVDPANETALEGMKHVVQDRILGSLHKAAGDFSAFLDAIAPARRFEISKSNSIRLAVPLLELMKLGLVKDEAFVVSRLAAGNLGFAELAAMSERSEDVLLATLEGLLDAGIIALA